MRYLHEPRKIPEILSIEEVTHLIQAAGSLRYLAALSVAYGAGLRASEITHLKITDVDGKRMILRVEQGKGGRDRHAMLSPELLKILRRWYRDGQSLLSGSSHPGCSDVRKIAPMNLQTPFPGHRSPRSCLVRFPRR